MLQIVQTLDPGHDDDGQSQSFGRLALATRGSEMLTGRRFRVNALILWNDHDHA